MVEQRPKILLGVTGSIAAYKAAELARIMIRQDWDVWTLMTTAATQYVGPLTFRALTRHPVATGNQEDVENATYTHLNLAKYARAFVVAPCTAHTIAKLAHGFAGDIIGATALSITCPLLVAPAMNANMWNNPATQENVEILKQRGVRILSPEEGELACGISGTGRLCGLKTIMAAVSSVLSAS